MVPEWLQYIKEGEIVILILISGGGLIMFKFLRKDCKNLRGECQSQISDKLHTLHDMAINKIGDVREKVDLKIEKVDVKIEAVWDKIDMVDEKLDDVLHMARENGKLLIEIIRNGKKGD